MNPSTKITASFRTKYWRTVARCLQLFPHGPEHANRIEGLRDDPTLAIYHLDPIDVVKDVLGLKMIPKDILRRYRAMRSSTAATLGQ